jgi:hypothetical protein
VYSSQIDSRRDAVLVNHTTQSIGSPDLTAAPSAIAGGVGFGGVRRTPDVDDVRCSDQRRREGTWWRCARLRTSSQSRHSERTVRTNRSATPFACGARTGVRTISIPSLRNTSSNTLVNFWPRSRIRNRTGSARSAKVHVTCRACWMTHGAVGCAVHPAEWTRRLPSSRKEQHVQPFQPDRVDREEINGEQTVSMRPDELAPCHPFACAGWSEACCPQPRADRRRRDRHATSLQLPDNPLIPPPRILSGQTDGSRLQP